MSKNKEFKSHRKSEEKEKVKRVLADKAYDSYDNFEFLQAKE